MKAFRIFGRNIRDSFKSVFRNISLSMASIMCITITLIVGGLYLILTGLEKKFGNKHKNKEEPLTNKVIENDENVEDVKG